MKKILLLLAILSFGGLVFISKGLSPADVKFKTIYINSHKFIVEIADTDEKRVKGLSDRDTLAQNAGMLFVFPTPGFYRFWMKDMKFPLDFVWINDDRIVDLTENVPATTSSSDLKTFTAKYPFDKVLEVNAGTVKLFNIAIGDTID